MKIKKIPHTAGTIPQNRKIPHTAGTIPQNRKIPHNAGTIPQNRKTVETEAISITLTHMTSHVPSLVQVI